MKESISKLRSALRPLYGNQETEAIIRLVFSYLKGWNLTDMLIHSDDILSPYIKQEIEKITRRLLNYEPIQYITGEARFHGLNLHIKPGVLIPRPETDELVDIIVKDNEHIPDLKILDLCTGSGCIAIALARSLNFPIITAIDYSPTAVETAKENASALKCDLKIIQEDIFKWVPRGSFDIIVSNPPYVDISEAKEMLPNVLNYEPHDAIFVPADKPLIFYERIADIGIQSLNEHGLLYLEINPIYALRLQDLLKSKGYENICIINDSFGKKRFISCSKSS